MSKLSPKQFNRQVEKICLFFGGIKDKFDHFIIQTDNYGQLSVKPFDNWIALKFLTYSTGKVYDSFLVRDFNGYSGKWNILCAGNVFEQREGGLRELELRLGELIKKIDSQDLADRWG